MKLYLKINDLIFFYLRLEIAQYRSKSTILNQVPAYTLPLQE